jgi:[ribosomal protein S18]-alanine N-acetyltransferase
LDAPSQFAPVESNIRNYRPADFDRLWQIDQLCFPPGIAYTQMELSGFISRRNAITLVAELRQQSVEQLQTSAAEDLNNLAGFVVAHPVRGKYGRILTLDIHPDARRLGLASQLMDACESRLRALGCAQVYLETAVNNATALGLYRKLGYEILRTLPEYYSSHFLDAFQMGKQL